MQRRTRLIIGGAIVASLAVAGATYAIASSDDSEGPITGDALDRATDAAIEHTGGGRVTDTEVGDEDSYYEVEVTLDDGTQVDVQLDAEFDVVSDDTDEPNEDEPGDG